MNSSSRIRRLRFPYPPTLTLRPPNPMLKPKESKHTLAGEGETANSSAEKDISSTFREGCFDSSTWRIIDSRSLGIQSSAIESSARSVLTILKQKGFGAYLVGGCVRDLLLHKTPKDFDVVTTAAVKKVKQQFHRAQIIGRRFPICVVYVGGSCVEVSSFETTFQKSKEEMPTYSQSQISSDHFVRWRDCLRRDFTINGLLYDPATNKIYDYVNGIRDIKACKVRTINPAYMSFKDDCARILRGIRVAARLGLRFSKETKVAMIELSSSITSLRKDRLLMEVNYMLAYGAAVPSICLLWKFKLLHILLPFHALYLEKQADSRGSKESTLLMSLFSKMDRVLSVDHPSDCLLWVGLLAFHLALVQSPQDTLTVWTFSSILCHGNLSEAIKFANGNAQVCSQFPKEILDLSEIKSDELLANEVSDFVSVIKSSMNILISQDALSEAIERCQMPSPSSSVVLVSKNLGRHVAKIFDVLDIEGSSSATKRGSCGINYNLLKKGDLKETRYVLGKVIMDVLKDGTKPRLNPLISGNDKGENLVKDIFYPGTENGVPLVSNSIKQQQRESFQEQRMEGNMRCAGIDLVPIESRSKNKKDRNATVLGNDQNKSEVVSKQSENSQIDNCAKQGEKQVTLQNQKRDYSLYSTPEHKNLTILENEVERNKMKKKIKRENGSIMLQNQAVLKTKEEGHTKTIKTKHEKCDVMREEKKNERKSEVVRDEKCPSLSKFFRKQS